MFEIFAWVNMYGSRQIKAGKSRYICNARWFALSIMSGTDKCRQIQSNQYFIKHFPERDSWGMSFTDTSKLVGITWAAGAFRDPNSPLVGQNCTQILRSIHCTALQRIALQKTTAPRFAANKICSKPHHLKPPNSKKKHLASSTPCSKPLHSHPRHHTT